MHTTDVTRSKTLTSREFARSYALVVAPAGARFWESTTGHGHTRAKIDGVVHRL
jgi:hypothetical protein